jgi:hypothetical protein
LTPSYLYLSGAPPVRDPVAWQALLSHVVVAPGLVGAWMGAGSIGWSDDENILLVAQGEPSSSDPASPWWRDLLPEPSVVVLEPTVRPATSQTFRTGGVHAHRWFHTHPDQADELIQLSAEAWPAFEAAFDATIEGLFRDQDEPGRLLLITWYASVAEWERSRSVAQASDGDLGRARLNFQRRRELTSRQIVKLATPAHQSQGRA